MPNRPRKLPRRRLAALLGAALAAGGGAALYPPRAKKAPVQLPGPRRYPPAYRAQN
jgi:hypothetical protein